MKDDPFKVISENIFNILNEGKVKLTPKELSEKSSISYSTLAPILRGERDFRISNLISIAEALGVSPNELLNGLFSIGARSHSEKGNRPPRYLVSFVTDVGLTHCRLINLETNVIENKIYPFSLFCTTEPTEFLMKIKNSIKNVFGDVDLKDVYLYVSILAYEHVDGRNKILSILNKEFGAFILEPDWMPVHKSLLASKDGILLTINNGYTISYSDDSGRSIKKIQGYSFPISDEAGNFWLGCEAIKHAINVKENVDPRSMLSDKVLSLVNSDLDLLATKAYDHQREFFVEVAGIVKELSAKKDMAYEIVRKGFNNIWERIHKIDQKIGRDLPVYLSGALAYLYEEFIPKKRLVHVDFENIVNTELDYTTNKLKELIKQQNIK